MMNICWNKFKNFKPEEFACKCGCDKGKCEEMNCNLIYALQAVRDKVGKPVNITSGHRCKEYNATLKGSISTSDHITWKAADFFINGVTNTKAKRLELMNYIVTLPNVTYCYCDGWIQYKGQEPRAYSAPNMKTSIHISVN